ncbi:MAG: hypothetical protein IJZ76_06005 [Lachnospiraceae bacterium]|nr:hypothetical protein [Lachnospiraceae bacterium]
MLINQNADKYDRKTEDYIVAYIDLLGMTNRIKKEKDDLTLNILHNLYTFSEQLTKEIDLDGQKDIQFKIFSDNIIVAKKLAIELEQRVRDIENLLLCVRGIQMDAASDSVGWLLRGGITIGKFFIDDVMVWGEALLRSYALEDKVANYPRIVLDDCVLQECIRCERLLPYCIEDFDGVHFLNYLHNCHFCGERLKNGFEKMKQEIESKVDDKTRQKMMWHKNFINAELDRKDEKQDRKYRLEF